MTINNSNKYLENIWDWSILRGCFGETIEPTDIDGLVERKGKFLLLETKSPEASLTEGQKIAFEKFAKRGDTVMIIWGEKDNPQRIELLFRGSRRIIDPANIEKLRALCNNWYEWANDNR